MHTVAGQSTTSQQDLNHDLALRRFASNRSPSKAEETADLAVRGKELASRCWSEDEEFLAKDKIAEWLGGQFVSRNSNVCDRWLIIPAEVSSTKLLYATTWTSLISVICGWTMLSGAH